jgi:hypothetical protein
LAANGRQFSSPEMQESVRKLYFLGALSVFKKLRYLETQPPAVRTAVIAALREEFAGFDEEMNVILAKSLRGELGWDGGVLSDL